MAVRKIKDLIYGIKELSEDVANAKGVDVETAKSYVYATIEMMKEAFTEWDYDRITIHGFGTFRLKPYNRNVYKKMVGEEPTDEKDYQPRINFSASDDWKNKTKINVKYDSEGNRITPKFRRGKERKRKR